MVHFVIVSSIANGFVITFDPPSWPRASVSLQNYTQNNLIFVGNLEDSFSHTDQGLPNRPDNETAHLDINRYYTSFYMTDSSTFSLYSVDLAEYSTVDLPPENCTSCNWSTGMIEL